ncbi:hypothetical protein PLESTF_001937300 [Pleodorina starrii]|nr:hypothetical protein PLESTF_001937300 [Pleodorina starrii]
MAPLDGGPQRQKLAVRGRSAADEFDEETASYDLITRSDFAADCFHTADEYEGAALNIIASDDDDDTCSEAPSDASADAEVDSCLEGITVTGIDVPRLDPDSKKRPVGAVLLQQSPCSSAWVTSLLAPDRNNVGGDWKQQPMLVKVYKFYCDALASRLLAAAARNGQKPRVHVPTERDAMQEVRMAVKLACTSVRRIRGAALEDCPDICAPSAAPEQPSGRDGGGGGGGQPILPVHLEVRPCAAKRSSIGSKCGPDREVVAVYPYHPPAKADLAEPSEQQ